MMASDDARADKPRMFAVFGVYTDRLYEADNGAFLGWGLDFGKPFGAILWEPGGAMSSAPTAEELVEPDPRIATARLLWL